MIYYVTYLKDVVGNNYIGVNIPIGIVEPYLNELKEILGDKYETYTQLQKNRDGGHYHITVIPVMDYNKLYKDKLTDFVNSIELIMKYPIDDIKLLGIGTASRNENTTYFIVCQSDKLDDIRNRFDLPKHDFHITLGFYHKDVFGVRKNEVLKKKSKFLQLLSSEFLKKENFNFLKNISNYQEDADLEIIPIELSNDFLKIKVGDYLMDIGMDDDNTLKVFTRYIDTKNLKRLPMTEIISVISKIDK